MKRQARIIRVKGSVFSGTGEGARFVGLSWVKSQIENKIGFKPYVGTLNLRLDGKNKKARKILEEANSIKIVPQNEYCPGKCFKARIMDSVEGAVVIPEVDGYPEDVLEVIAPINLRKRFRLKNGDCLEISILLE